MSARVSIFRTAGSSTGWTGPGRTLELSCTCAWSGSPSPLEELSNITSSKRVRIRSASKCCLRAQVLKEGNKLASCKKIWGSKVVRIHFGGRGGKGQII